MKRHGPAELVVFLGPSLPAAEASKLAPCRVLPPARQGDVWRALALRPKVIAIIDGVFESVPSVWHHEILAALDAGVAVLGASSMGALRAAELGPQGMVGVGRIFGLYRDGELTDDAEVALLHAGAEAGFEAFTVPLVNVRHNAERARKARALSEGEARALVKAGQSIFFQDRTWPRVLEAAKLPATARSRWDAWARRKGLEDLKALDARACLVAANRLLKQRGEPMVGSRARPSSLVRRRRLLEGASLRDGERLVRNERVLNALAGRASASEEARQGLLTLLVAGWARELGLRVGDEEVAAAESCWWRGQGAVPKAGRDAYLARNGLDRAEARRLWETLALERKVLESSARMLNDGPSWDEGLAFQAWRTGLWARTEAAEPIPGGRRRFEDAKRLRKGRRRRN